MLLGMSLAWAVEVTEVPNPREAGVWVTDLAEVVDAADEAALNELLDQLEADTSAEVAVVTVDSVSGTAKEFTTELFAHWGVGKADKDNGLLVVLVMDQRRLEMETGYGLEGTLSDSWLGGMQQREMVPAFRQGDFGAGLVAGVEASAERLRADPTVHGGTAAPPVPVDEGGVPVVPLMAWFGLLGGGAFFLRRGYRANRQCDAHGEPVDMVELDEVADDAFLTEGQQAEEALGSVNYTVYQCPICEETRMFSRRAWFSGYKDCLSCGQRTASSSRHVVSAATYSSSGRARVTTTCSYCGHQHVRTVVIPKKVRSTSSSSGSSFGGGGGGYRGGGGSFGGGRSGGGGAGSSW